MGLVGNPISIPDIVAAVVEQQIVTAKIRADARGGTGGEPAAWYGDFSQIQRRLGLVYNAFGSRPPAAA